MRKYINRGPIRQIIVLLFLCLYIFPNIAVAEESKTDPSTGTYIISEFNNYCNSISITVDNFTDAVSYNILLNEVKLSDTSVKIDQPIINVKEVLSNSSESLTAEFYGQNPDVIIASAILRDGELSITRANVDECFIATAAFGSKFEPCVVILRQFRDDCLLTNNMGTRFVNMYYKNSPPLAHYIAEHIYLKIAVRVALIPFIIIAYLCINPKLMVIFSILLFIIVFIHNLKFKHKYKRAVSILLLVTFITSIVNIPYTPEPLLASVNKQNISQNADGIYGVYSFGGTVKLEEVSNDSLCIGKDIYSRESQYYDLPHLQASLQYGGNHAYVKKNNKWYNILKLRDDEISKTDNAEKDYNVSGWRLRYWYKADIEIGELVDTEPPLLISAIGDVASDYVILQMNEKIKLPDPSIIAQLVRNKDNTIVQGNIEGFFDEARTSLKVKISNALGNDVWTVKIGPLSDEAGNVSQLQLSELIYRKKLPVLSIIDDNGFLTFQLDNTLKNCTYTINSKCNNGEFTELEIIDPTKSIVVNKETTQGVYTYQVIEKSSTGQTVRSNDVKYIVTSRGSGLLTDDSDGDGLNDELEDQLGADKTRNDTDEDGLPDGYEHYFSGTSVTKADTDENGVIDAIEDADLDGLNNLNEYRLNTHPQLADSDNDGLDDGEEINIYKTNPLLSDTDEDLLSDYDEIILGFNPLEKDTDKNGILDSDEKVQQTVSQENIASNLLYSNEAIPSLALSASGNVNNKVDISEYKGCEFGESRSIIGKPISISGVDFNNAEISFTLKNTITGSELLSEPAQIYNKNLICRYDEDGRTVYYETDYDNETKKLSAVIDAPGKYFVLNVEEMFNELGLSLPSEMLATKVYAESTVTLMSQNELITEFSPDELQSMYNTKPEEGLTDQDKNDQTGIYSKSESETANMDSRLEAFSTAAGQADIVFIIDTTSSMSGEIDNVKDNATAFVDALKERGIAPYFALVDYQDITCDGIDSTKVHKNLSSNWFSNIEDYKNTISSLRLGYGGDYPECAIDALETARLLDMRANAGKFFILVTDANYKNDNRYGIPSMDYEIALLKNQKINTSVITSSGLKSIYNNLFTETGGIYADINGDFNKELMAIADKIGEVVDDGVWVYLDGPIPVAVKLKKEPSADDTITDTDEDGIPDIQELKSIIPTREINLDDIITKISKGAITGTNYGMVKMYEYYSNPAVGDTDKDGYMDGEDLEPKIKYITPVILIHGMNKDSYKSFGVASTFATHEYSLNDHYIGDNIAAGMVVKSLSNSLGKNFLNPFRDDITPENYYSFSAQMINSIDRIGIRASQSIASNLVLNGYEINKNLFAINYPNKDFVWKNADVLEWYLSTLKNDKAIYPTLSAYDNKFVKFILVAEGSGGYIARYYNEVLSDGNDVGKIILFETNSDISNFVGITSSDIITHTTLIQPINADIKDDSMMKGGSGNSYSALNPFIQEKLEYINNYQTGPLNSHNHHNVEYNNFIGVDNSNCLVNNFTHLVKYNKLGNKEIYIERDGDLITRSSFEKMFENSSSQYSKNLAELSIEAALYAYDDIYRLEGEREPQGICKPNYLIDMLEYLGFINIIPYNYNDKNMHNNSFVLATKEILNNGEIFNLVAVILRGTDSVEWNGDFEIWENIDDKDRKTAYSFEKGKECIYEELKKYTAEMDCKNTKLWITGHSRGAAVANLLGAELSNYKEDKKIALKDNIFVYTYATPNVRLESVIDSENVNNIFNFVNTEDFVTKVPLVSWGYGKYGITKEYNINTIKSDSEFNKYYTLAGQIACKNSDLTADAVVKEFYKLASSVEEYYTEKHPLEKYHSLREFAFEVIANAAQGINTDELKNAYLWSLTYWPIAAFFVHNEQKVWNKAISYNHNPHTYYAIMQYANTK